jgi:hypothetical protein
MPSAGSGQVRARCAHVAADGLDEPADIRVVAGHRAFEEGGVHDRLAERAGQRGRGAPFDRTRMT